MNNIAPLFEDPDDFTQNALIALGKILDKVIPQNAAQHKDLKYAVRDLSAMLTTERVDLAKPYWSNSRLMSAYIRFFMPWNLMRLTQLLPNLELPVIEDEDIVFDMGSGPLTFPIALWIARKDYRDKAITLIVSDSVSRPMEYGKEILIELAAAMNTELKWAVHLVKNSFSRALREIHGKPKLILSGNMLNEQESKQTQQRSETEEMMFKLAEQIKTILLPDGAYLAVEPGTRQGGRLMGILRIQALENELYPHAPCTHTKDCPVHENTRIRTWCHCQCPAYSPAWLRALSKDAGLERDNLTLSFLLLKHDDPGTYLNTARILSDTFPVPELGGCRYGCTDRGLVLIDRCSRAPASSLIEISIKRKRDGKSGAFISTPS